VNARRDTARRWVIDERKSDQEVGHLIVVSYDEGTARIEMEGYVNEARAELGWWTSLEKAYRESGYLPSLDLVASKMGIAPKTLRQQCRDHGIGSWRDVHPRFAK
jgi:hypothetical protein